MDDDLDDEYPTLAESEENRRKMEEALERGRQRMIDIQQVPLNQLTGDFCGYNSFQRSAELERRFNEKPSSVPKQDLFGGIASVESAETAQQWFNQRFAVITDNGKTQVYWIHEDGKIVAYNTNNDFFGAWANKKTQIITTDPNKKQTSKFVESAKDWFYDYQARRTYHFTTFDPKGGAPPNTFNFWPGFGVKGVRGAPEYKIIIRFIYEIICSKDKRSFKYLVRWTAHMVQKPWKKPEVSIVLIGAKGTGKSLFAKFLERLIDGLRKYVLCYETVKEKDFTGDFNDHLRHKLLLIIDEASYIASPRVLSVINDLITSEDVSVGKKFASTTMSVDFLRMIINANPPWSLPVTWDERRFLALSPSQEMMGNHEHYRGIADALNDIRVMEALHWFFMQVNIGNFNPHKVPHTEAMMRNRIAQLKGVELWAFELANDGFIDAWKIEGDAYALKETVRQSYNEWHAARYNDKKEIDKTKFGMEFARLLPAIDDKGNVIMNKGRVVSILEKNKQRNSAILKQRPGLSLDETKFSYSYVLPALDHFRNLLIISLKIRYDWTGNMVWDFFSNRPL